MDLFIMKRYGEDERRELANQEDHLSSLLTKIEKRKSERRRISEDEEGKETHLLKDEKKISECIDKAEKQRPAKKKKHKSVDDETGTVMETTNEKLDGIDESPRKKKKRKKLEELCDILHLNEPIDERKDSEEKVQGDTPTEFTILETKKFSKKLKVKRVLPYWLANPFVVSGSMAECRTTVNDIPSLDKDLVTRLEENKISHFFPVQSEVIPWLLEAHKRPMQYRPNDVCISAPTGSGKTLAFVLPVVQALKSRVMRHIRALVVLPVQQLAMQIYDVFGEYCKETDLKVILLTGDKSFTTEQQDLVKQSTIIGQYNAVDIVITTPGRLVEHIVGTPGFSLKYLRFLIIDEADRIMDSMSNDWLYHLENHIHGELSGKQTSLSSLSLQTIPPPPQKLLFSATLTQDPEKLQGLGLFQPKLFTVLVGDINNDTQDVAHQVRGNFVGKYTTPAELTEKYCVTSAEFKPLVLFHMICKENWKNVICFTNSQENTHRLAVLLKHLGGGSFPVGEISSSHRRRDRVKVLRKFSIGKVKVLVSTDALARGIDISDVDYIVSYDVPKFVKTYIHRIGRTARAGKTGTAVTFLVNEEINKFKNMLRTAGKEESIQEFTVTEPELEYLEEDYMNALQALRKTIRVEKGKTLSKENIIKTYNPNYIIKKKKKHFKVRKHKQNKNKCS